MTVDEMEHLSTLSSIFFVGMWKYTLCSLQDQTHYGAWNFYIPKYGFSYNASKLFPRYSYA